MMRATAICLALVVLLVAQAQADRNITSFPWSEDMDTSGYTSDLLRMSTGCSHTYLSTGGWDGGGAARFEVGYDGAYCGLGSLSWTGLGSQSQLNVRIVYWVSTDYAENETRNNKLILVTPQSGTRPMMFHKQFGGAGDWIGFAPCDGTVCDYLGGNSWPETSETFRMGSGTYEQEWVSLEFEMITGTQALNLYVTTRDGLFTGLYNGSAATLDGWTGGLTGIDTLTYFNDTPGDHRTPGAGEYYIIDDVAVSDSYIGPPTGFVSSAAANTYLPLRITP